MIKSNELRIGNYVYVSDIVTKVGPSIITDVWESERTWLKPIPLIEEWLIKCSFDKIKLSPQHNRFDFKGISILQRINDNEFWFHNTKIEHLHHLQNIFHALENEELTITQ